MLFLCSISCVLCGYSSWLKISIVTSFKKSHWSSRETIFSMPVVTWRVCLHPGSCSLTSGAAQWGSADSCDQPAGVTSQLRRPWTEKKASLCLRSPLPAAENRTAFTPVTRPRLPASCRMSVGAPRGLASSGQKPIAEILHPLSAAEEPLLVPVNVGGEKVGSAGAEPRPVHRSEHNQGM